jgi:hypothetical protein
MLKRAEALRCLRCARDAGARGADGEAMTMRSRGSVGALLIPDVANLRLSVP